MYISWNTSPPVTSHLSIVLNCFVSCVPKDYQGHKQQIWWFIPELFPFIKCTSVFLHRLEPRASLWHLNRLTATCYQQGDFHTAVGELRHFKILKLIHKLCRFYTRHMKVKPIIMQSLRTETWWLQPYSFECNIKQNYNLFHFYGIVAFAVCLQITFWTYSTAHFLRFPLKSNSFKGSVHTKMNLQKCFVDFLWLPISMRISSWQIWHFRMNLCADKQRLHFKMCELIVFLCNVLPSAELLDAVKAPVWIVLGDVSHAEGE